MSGLRIVAGESRGRALKTPKGPGIRPTSGRVREALFNILGQRLDGLAVLDLFAGTGALGLEALSRGAARATFVDSGREALGLVRQNIAILGVGPRCRVIELKVTPASLAKLSPTGPHDLIFADPPYAALDAPELLAALGASGLLAKGGRVVLERSSKAASVECAGGLWRFDSRSFGDTALDLYQTEPPLP